MGVVSIDPKFWQFIVQLVMAAAQNTPTNRDGYDVDLPTLRDRMGMKDFIKGGADPKPPPMEVSVVGGAPWPYASGV